MGSKIKITTKIYLGFSVAVMICVVLGAYGIWNFSDIRRETSILTDEYVPEVSILSQLERNASKTMYNLRGYSFTGNEHFLEQGVEAFENAQLQVKDAKELVPKAPHLKALASTIDSIETNLKKYKVLIEETKTNQKSMASHREAMNVAATEAMKNAEDFLEDQYKSTSQEIASGTPKDKLQERLSKINQMSSVINLMNASRIAAWKAQEQDDVEGLQKILPNFPEIALKIKAVRAMTRLDTNLRQLDVIDASARKYGLAIDETIRAMNKMIELNAKRNETGDDVLEAIAGTTRAGMEGTIRIAESSGRIVNNSVLMFSIGLLVAVVVSGFLAFLIASGIGRALRGIIEKLKDSSQQVTESASQLSSAAQQLSGASNEQASSIEETSSSLEQISGMIENNVGNAEQSFRLSSEVMGVSETANESMRKLEISIKEILASNDKIEQLVKVIGNIGEKTKVMDEIVFQTKLLSFNASVEAERAGEHGRGFAVVAQEVGNLAQMSGKSAQEIAEIVKSSIHEAESITTENRKKVDQGNQYVEESAKGLKMIMEAAKTVSSGSNQVLQASKDQALGIKQVSSAMTELDNATQQNAATAEETAASSEELSAQAEVLNSIVGDLYMLVEGQAPMIHDSMRPRKSETPVNRTPGKVVHLAQRKKPGLVPTPMQKKAVGSDIDPTSSNRSDEAWEKL